MTAALTYHLRRFSARLHRMRLALHARGWGGLVERITKGAGPSLSTPAPQQRTPAAIERGPLQPGRSRILLIDVSTPRPDRDSGSVRAFNLMRLLTELGHHVDFLPDDRADAGTYTDALRAMGVDVVLGDRARGYPTWFSAHLARYDAIVISRYHLAEHLIPLVRRIAPRIAITLDTVDLHFVREQREAELRHDRTLQKLATATRRRELAAIASADTTWVVSTAERDLLADVVPDARVVVLPNIIADIASDATPGGRSGLLFIGGARHPPNIDAIEWLLGEIAPLVHSRMPECVFHVVGEGTRAIAGKFGSNGVVAHDHVDDLAPLLANCRAGVAPLRFGAGVKGKVNLYMSQGLPSVLTTCAAEGMHVRHGTDAMVADDAAGFCASIIALCSDDALWRTVSESGLRNVRQHFSFDAARAAIEATLVKAR